MSDIDDTEDCGDNICSCCGEQLPMGLFAKIYSAPLPLAVRLMPQDTVQIDDRLIRASGRVFILCLAPLPLSFANSPVKVKSWVECDERTALRLSSSVAPAGLDNFVGEGVLASDLGSFAGSIGAGVAISAGETLPVIRRVLDDRILALPPRPSHEDLIDIYRQTWGNSRPVVDADPVFRLALNRELQKSFSRPCYRRPVEPPASLSGISPAEILVAPPFDVDEKAFMATIGCGEVSGVGMPTEMVTSAYNPSPEFVHSFAEFCYLSRLNSTILARGLVVPERQTIPGTSRMSSWILMEPSSADNSLIQDTLVVEDREVQILAAVPLYPEENFFAQREGVAALFDRLDRSEASLADLSRPSSVSGR